MKNDSEYKLHRSVLFLDKNVDNYIGEKLLLSLGYDDRVDEQSGQIAETALVFKIWNFIELGGKHFYNFDALFRL